MEREADRIADEVTGAPHPRLSSTAGAVPDGGRLEPCGSHDGLCGGEREAHAGAGGALALAQSVLRAPGRALDAATRAYFEPRFGQDFSDVRLHVAGAAAASADALDASAYAVGRDIVFGTEMFAPTTPGGRHLLAHELAHVVQQAGGRRVIQREPRVRAGSSPEPEPVREIVKIVVDEGSRHATAYFAGGGSGPVELTQNKLEPGDYALTRSSSQPSGTFSAYSGRSESGLPVHDFVWRGHGAQRLTVLVVPGYVRDFLTANEDGNARARIDPAEELNVARILTRDHVSETELLLEHQHQIEARAKGGDGGGGDLMDWALSFAGRRREAQRAALTDHAALNAAAKRLADANNEVRQIALARVQSESHEANVLGAAQLDRRQLFSWGEFRDKADVDATVDAFSKGLEAALHALAEGMLNEAAATIFKIQRSFVGAGDKGIGYGYLEQALDNARGDKDVSATLSALAEARKRLAALDQDLAGGNGQGAGADYAPLDDKTQKRRDAAAKRVDALGEDLQQQLGEKWKVHLSGVEGVDAEALLASKPAAAQTMLASGLATSARKIEDARRLLRNDSKFVFKADRVVALEKQQLHIEAGTPLDRLVDAIVREGGSPTTFWGDLWDVINFVVGFVPPPAGPIMRAVVGGINLGKALDERAEQDTAHAAGLASTGGASITGTLLVTAAGVLFDAGELTGVGSAEREGVSLGAEGEAREGMSAGPNGTSLAGGEGAAAGSADAYLVSPHGAFSEALEAEASQAAKEAIEHPQIPEGEVGHQSVPAGERHRIEEVTDPGSGAVTCEFHSSSGPKVKCPPGMGDPVAEAKTAAPAAVPPHAAVKAARAQLAATLNQERATVGAARDSMSSAQWAAARAGKTKRLYNLLERRAVLMRMETFPGRVYLEQAEVVGVRSNGVLRATETISSSGKGRIADILSLDGSRAVLEDLKSSSTQLKSVGGGLSSADLEVEFRSTSEIAKQHVVEEEVLAEARLTGGQVIVRGRDPLTGVTVEHALDPDAIGSAVSNYTDLGAN